MSQPRTSGKNPLIISRPAARGRSLPSATAQETAAPWLNPPTAVFSQGIPRRSSSSSRNPQSPVSVSTKVRSSGCPTSRITYQWRPPGGTLVSGAPGVIPNSRRSGSSSSSMGWRSRSSTPRPCSRISAPSGSPAGSRTRWTSPPSWLGPPPCSGRDTWVVDLAQDRLDLLPEVLVVGRQRELLAERLERLVDREAGAQGRDLEEHTARLAEVDRAEVEAVDHRGGPASGLDHALAPGLVVVHLRGPGDVVNAAGALQAALGRRLGIAPEAATALAAGLPARLPRLAADRLEAERTLEQWPTRLGIAGVRDRPVEALERHILRDLRMLRHQRLVIRLDDLEGVPESLRVGEPDDAVVAPVHLDPLLRQALLPEVQGPLGAEPPPDAPDHPLARAALRRTGILEESQVGAGIPLLVGVEEVVDGRIVLV